MKHYIIIALVLHVLGLLGLLFWRGFDVSETFSQKAAKSNLSAVLYALSFLAPFTFLYFFFVYWFIPHFDLPILFYVFTVSALLFQIVCTFFPERGGFMKKTHRILTGISAVCLMPLMVMLIFAGLQSTFSRVVSAVSLVGMLYLLSVGLRNLRGHQYALLLQISYYGAFFITIISVTYL